MPVVSVKVDERTKRGMIKYREEIDWPDEIRMFIASRVEQLERRENIKAVEKLLQDVPELPKGSVSNLVRRDRDSGH